MNQGFESNLWGTYKQWKDKGGNVSKGSKGTRIVFFKMVDKKNEDGKFAFLRESVVFNLDQTNSFGTDAYDADADTLKDLRPVKVELTEAEMTERYELAEIVVKGTGATINYKEQDRAFYSCDTDHITMPIADQFNTTAGYYGTLFHELAHWTGSEKRLDRNLKNSFGSKDYAKEELVAELSTAMTCALLEVPNLSDETDSVSYLSHWIKQLKADPNMIMKVSSASRKATDYILKPTQHIHGLLNSPVKTNDEVVKELNQVHAQGVNDEITPAEWEARTLELESQLQRE